MNAIGPNALAGVVKPQHAGKKIGRCVTHVKVCVRRRYSKAGGSSALILNDENGMCAKRISGSDCDITIRQKRA